MKILNMVITILMYFLTSIRQNIENQMNSLWLAKLIEIIATK